MNTQAERLGYVLNKMKIDITEDDRKAAYSKFGHNAATVSRYLNGKILDNDTAASLIKFFKERIAARDEIAVWVPPLKSQKQIA